jgi:hypothetical protein
MSEIWKQINNYENYEVSNEGNIRNKNTGKILKKYIRNGYYSLSLCKNNKSKTVNIHRIVAEHFLDYQENKHVNHKDLNKLNNNINNLEYVSPKENAQHAIKNGATKINPRKIGQYKEGKLIQSFNSIIEAEKKTGISNKHIGSVCRGNRKTSGGYEWKYLDEEFTSIDKEDIDGKVIIDYPNYMITKDGKIYSIKRKNFLKPRKLPNGYLSVKLCNKVNNKDFYIHVLQKKYYK